MLRTTIIFAAIATCIAQQQEPMQSSRQQSKQQGQNDENAETLQQAFSELKQGKDITKYLADDFEVECPQKFVSKGLCPSNKLDLATVKKMMAAFKSKGGKMEITEGPEIYGSGENLTATYQSGGTFNGKQIPQNMYAESLTFDDEGKISKAQITKASFNWIVKMINGKVQYVPSDQLRGTMGSTPSKNLNTLKQAYKACADLDSSEGKANCNKQPFAADLQVNCSQQCMEAEWFPCEQEMVEKDGLPDLLQKVHANLQSLNFFDIGNDMVITRGTMKGQGSSTPMGHYLENVKFNENGEMCGIEFLCPVTQDQENDAGDKDGGNDESEGNNSSGDEEEGEGDEKSGMEKDKDGGNDESEGNNSSGDEEEGEGDEKTGKEKDKGNSQ